MSDVPHYQMFIDGGWVEGDSTHEIHAPATGKVSATVTLGGVDHLEQAVEAAHRAHREGVWRSKSPQERAEVMGRMISYLEDHAGELAALVTAENGATVRQANAFHIGLSIASMQFLVQSSLAYEFEKDLGDLEQPLPAHGWIRRDPLGVIAAILPFNFPLLLGIWKIVPALAAGNTMVVKPDEDTPLTLLELGKAAEAAGLPAGVLNVVTGPGETVGSRMADHPDIRKIAFTGSTEVGRHVMRGAAANIKKVTLELGGKGPSVILDDANLDLAVPGCLFAFLMYNGQACESGTRILVPRSQHDEIVGRLVEKMRTLTVGDPLDPATDVGPIFNAEAVERIEKYVASAQADGATIAYQGQKPEGEEFAGGHWVAPALLTGVDNNMQIAREEIFGPVGVVIPYDTVEEAIEIANDTEYGLAAGVWGGDEDRAMEVAGQLESGTVWINDWHQLAMVGPFGGFKQSGLGRELGMHALDEYTEAKYLHRSANQDPQQRLYGLLFGF